jgi:hypothetical protein
MSQMIRVALVQPAIDVVVLSAADWFLRGLIVADT